MEAGQHFVGLVLIGCVIGGDVSRVPTLDAVHGPLNRRVCSPDHHGGGGGGASHLVDL